MIQSPQVLEWQAEARAEGEARGEAKGKVEGKVAALIRLLELRFKTVPPDVVSSINATRDLTILDQWFDLAVTSATLVDFRQATGL